MIIKKFTAKTEEEAVRQAKAELGENIVIMNVKTVPSKGLFGFLKKAQVEVTVAKEEENERYPYAQGAGKPEEANLRETFRQVAKAAGMDKTAQEFLNKEERSGASRGGSFDKRLDDVELPPLREERARSDKQGL